MERDFKVHFGIGDQGANLEFVAGCEPEILRFGFGEDHKQFVTAIVDSLAAFHHRSDSLVSCKIFLAVNV